jgi:hypothetical protein
VKTEITVAKECSNDGLETLGGDESGDNSRSHARHTHPKGKKVRRVLEEVFLKAPAQHTFVNLGQLFVESYVGETSFHAPAYLIRPFYYVLLFRYALF